MGCSEAKERYSLSSKQNVRQMHSSGRSEAGLKTVDMVVKRLVIQTQRREVSGGGNREQRTGVTLSVR